MLHYENPIYYIAVFIGILLVLIYRYLIAHNNYWKDRRVPFKPPLLVYGNFKDNFRLKKSYGEVIKDIYNEFRCEPFIGIFQSRTPELVIRDLELIKHILVKDFRHFQDRSTEAKQHEKLSGNIFMVTGPKWKIIRKKFTPIFSSGKLKSMFNLVLEKGEDLKKYMEVSLKMEEDQDVRDIFSKFSMDIVGSCGFGVVINALSDTEVPFIKMGYKIFESSKLKSLKLFLHLFCPKFFNYFKVNPNDPKIHDFFISIVKETIEQRKKTHEKRHDFIDLLLELKKTEEVENGEDQIEFDDVFMAAQAYVFFAAGFETSSTLMYFILHELSLQQDIQEKVYKEIEEVLGKNNGKLTFDSIADMHYLEMVLSETLRKYPPLGSLTRKCVLPYTNNDFDLTIDIGTTIEIPVLGIHYDPQYYPEPHKFIPERFTAEAKQARHPMTYLPFGEGPRNCVGLRFGKMQSKVGVISFLQKYEVIPCARIEKKMEFDAGTFVTTPKDGFWLRMKRRNFNKSTFN